MTSTQRSLVLARTLCRIRVRRAAAFLLSFRGVVSAVAVLVVLFVGSGPLRQLATSPLAGESDALTAIGVLGIGQLFLALSTVFCVPLFMLRSFEREKEPAESFSFASPELHRIRLFGDLLLPSAVYLTLFHLMFFAGSVRVAFGGGWVLASYAVAMPALLVPVGALSAVLFRRWVGAGGSGRRIGLTRGLGAPVFLALFAAPVLIVPEIGERAPGLLVGVGETFAAVALAWPPLVASRVATGFAGPVGVLVGVILTASVLAGGWRLAEGWSLRIPLLHLREIGAGQGPSRRPRPLGIRFASENPGRLGTTRAFLLKDMILPLLRRPARHLAEVAVLATALLTVSVVLSAVRDRGLPGPVTGVGVEMAVLLVPFWAGARWGLPSLGRELRMRSLLRPLLRPHSLLVAKSLSTIAFAFPHAVLGALWVVLLSTLMGLPAPAPARLLVVASAAGVLLPLFGTAVGFFLPGRAGASLSGRALYAIGAAVLVVLHALAELAIRLEIVSSASGAASELALAPLVALLAALLIGAAGLASQRLGEAAR